MKKKAIEILLVKAELTGIPEKRLLKSRNVGVVDIVWPRTGIALWCGDNEVARAINWYPEEKRKFLTINYDRLNRAIGERVEKCDPRTSPRKCGNEG